MLIFANACINFSIDWTIDKTNYAKTRGNKIDTESIDYPVGQLLRELFNCAIENKLVVLDCLKQCLIKYINTHDDYISFISAEIALNLNIINAPFSKGEDSKIIDNVEEEIFTYCSDKIYKISQQHISICYACFYQNKISIKNIVEWHGIETIFQFQDLNVYGSRFLSITEFLLRTVLFKLMSDQQ